MGSKKTVSKVQLNNLIKTLPVPVQEHLKRCKLFAAFIIDRISTEDWFIEGGYRKDDLVSAVGYHDIGKCAIPKDALYLGHCDSKSKKEKYYSHVSEGISLIETDQDINLLGYRRSTFERTLYDAITQHHERIDGEGFPSGLRDEELSLVGKITAIVDTFDNAMFVGAVSKPELEPAAKKLEKLAGTALDARLVEILVGNREVISDFIEFIDSKKKNERGKDKYGIHLYYIPIFDIRENKFCELTTEIYINDPYYGIVGQETLLTIANKTGQVFRLEKIAFEKMCMLIEKMARKGIEFPRVMFNFSARQFEKKNFFKDIDKIISTYGIDRSRLCFGARESDIVQLEDGLAKKMLDEFHTLGAIVSLNDFGDRTYLLSSLDSLPFDRVSFKKGYTKKITENARTFSVISGIVKIARNLHMSVSFGGIDERMSEVEVLRMGVRYAYGNLYGLPMRENELIQYLTAGGQDQ